MTRILAGIAIMASLSAAVSAADRSSATREQLKTLRERIAHVRQTINADDTQRKQLAGALDKAENRVVNAQARLGRINDKIEHDQNNIDQLADEIDAERAQLGGQLDRLRRQVRAAYIQGRTNPMRILLSDRSPSRIGRQLAYYRYFTDAQRRRIEHLKKALAELGHRQDTLRHKKSALADTREKRAETLARLRRSEQAQKKTLAALDRRLSSHKADLSSMRANEKKLKNLLDSLGSQLSNVKPPENVDFASRKGGLDKPLSGHVIAAFGQPRSGGPMRWQGRWLAAPAGTPVHAVAPGRVVYVGYMKRYGLIIIIDHGDRYYTLFGHASSAFCRVGDAVAAGEKIASAGHSGGHSRDGIFFQIRRGTHPLDPARWLAH